MATKATALAATPARTTQSALKRSLTSATNIYVKTSRLSAALCSNSYSTISNATPATPNSSQVKAKAPTALLFMNLGGPATLDDVQPFLRNLFLDPDLIPIPFQPYLAPIIAKRRTPSIQAQYKQIGGGSPIGQWTETQGLLVAKALDTLSPQTAPHKPYTAFRYAAPLTADALAQMKEDGVTRAVAFTLYPQYSCSTTGSSLNELYRKISSSQPQNNSGSAITANTIQDIQWSVVDRWPTHSGLIDSFAEKIKKGIESYPENERNSVILLFSAHSLPMSVVNRGDPYPAEVAATVHAVMTKLGHKNPYRLIWQSQVGPQPWLGPQTDKVIEGYAAKGEKNLLIIPIAFVSDHVETLFEVDVEYAHLAKEKGVSGFKRVESLNADPTFINGMATMLAEHLKNVYPEGTDSKPSIAKTSVQMALQCPNCTNPTCRKQKDFFAGVAA